MDIHPRVYGRETALYIGRGGVGFPYVAFLLFFSFVFFRPRLKSTYMQRKKQLVGGEEKEKTKKKKLHISQNILFAACRTVLPCLRPSCCLYST